MTEPQSKLAQYQARRRAYQDEANRTVDEATRNALCEKAAKLDATINRLLTRIRRAQRKAVEG